MQKTTIFETESSTAGTGGFLHAFNSEFLAELDDSDYDTFQKLSTDEARFAFVYNHSVAQSLEIDSVPSKKCTKTTQTNKDKGNKNFAEKNYDDAVHYYNTALLYVPPEEKELYSILIANRSACFYHLGEYDKSLADMEHAFESEYPPRLAHKLYVRMCRIYIQRKQYSLARTVFQKAEEMSVHANFTSGEAKKYEAELQKLKKEASGTKDGVYESKAEDFSHVHIKRDKKYVSLSSHVKIDCNKEMGRFAVAKKNIETGQIIVVENPHCAVLMEGYHLTHCQECVKPTLNFVPCHNCTNVIFCSKACRDIAMNSYHKYECPIFEQMWTSGASVVCLMALRMIVQQNLSYFLQVRDLLNKKMSEKEVYLPSDYRTVYNLCRNEKLRVPADFFPRASGAVFLLRLLQKSNYFNFNIGKDLTDIEKYIGGLILRNLQVLQFNSHEISELQFKKGYPDDVDKAESVCIAGGLFPTLALFNHSCDPHAVRYYNGKTVVDRIIRPVREGEMIGENYGPLYTETPAAERQNVLYQRYWFQCNCEPCIKDWPIFVDWPANTMRLRCKNCKYAIEVSNDYDDISVICTNCKKKQEIMSSLIALKNIGDNLEKADSLYYQGNFKTALREYSSVLDSLNKYLVPPFRDFVLCQQKIRRCFLMLGNKFKRS